MLFEFQYRFFTFWETRTVWASIYAIPHPFQSYYEFFWPYDLFETPPKKEKKEKFFPHAHLVCQEPDRRKRMDDTICYSIIPNQLPPVAKLKVVDSSLLLLGIEDANKQGKTKLSFAFEFVRVLWE